ncbi:MAG: DUF4832 domain-containing protein [Patescibacteria group bacterium]
MKQFLVIGFLVAIPFISSPVFIHAQVSTQTITPVKTSMSSPEIVNPLRGYYRWRGVELMPLPEPAQDHYQRYTWNELETSKGIYNFSKIDADLAVAKSAGAKFGFRIRSMTGYADSKQYVPAYMQSIGWWADTDGNGSTDTFVPDWNSQEYLAGTQRLMAALGARYNSDPSIAFLDIGMFGQYGEWTLSSRVDHTKAPAGVSPLSTSSAESIIDAHVNAFPDVQLLMSLRSKNNPAMRYAYSRPTKLPIGSRADCVGQQNYFSQFQNNIEVWNIISERWKIAPFISEYCSGALVYNSTSGDSALKQVRDLHISAIGNGNVSYSSLLQADRDAYALIGKTAGYRLGVNSINITSPLLTGAPVTFTTNWFNDGVAPVYEQWNVLFSLKNDSSIVVWTSTSSVSLKNILPTNGSSVIQSDTFIINSVTPGTYSLSMKIIDPRKTRRPLKLAIAGLQPDGSYTLGQVQVAGTQIQYPTVTLVGSPSSLVAGQSSSLTWSAFSSDTCTSADFSTNNQVSGQVQVTPLTSRNYSITCSSAAGTVNATANISVTPQIDSTPPSVPTNLTATSTTAAQTYLSWQNSTDNTNVGGYNIYRNGTLITSVAESFYSDSGLSQNTDYTYTVSAFDSAGNVSAQSNPITMRTSLRTIILEQGVTIQLTQVVTVMSQAGMNRKSKIIGTQAIGSTGLIVSGSKTVDGVVWWKIDFSSGADGWVPSSALAIKLARSETGLFHNMLASAYFSISNSVETLKDFLSTLAFWR